MVGVDAVLLGDQVHNHVPFWAKVSFQVSQWKLQDLRFQILIKKNWNSLGRLLGLLFPRILSLFLGQILRRAEAAFRCAYLICSKSRIGRWLPGMSTFSSCVSVLRWEQCVHHTFLFLPLSPGPCFPQKELPMCSQSSLILEIGYWALCPVGSKPGLEHLDSVRVTPEFRSTLSSPGSFLPSLR